MLQKNQNCITVKRTCHGLDRTKSTATQLGGVRLKSRTGSKRDIKSCAPMRQQQASRPRLTKREMEQAYKAKVKSQNGGDVKRAIRNYSAPLAAFGVRATTIDNRDMAYQLGHLKRNGEVVPVYAVRCDPNNVDAYTKAISGLKGLVIAINADAMEIPDASLCYGHKAKGPIGKNGQAARLREKGKDGVVERANAALAKKGRLQTSEAVAIKVTDDIRGEFKPNALLMINGPRIRKFGKTTEKAASALRSAFNLAVRAAKSEEIGSDKMIYTGVSTGIFGFDAPRGGAVAMESMIDELATGNLTQAVGAFWCNRDGSFAGSAAEGASATLFAHPDFHALA